MTLPDDNARTEQDTAAQVESSYATFDTEFQKFCSDHTARGQAITQMYQQMAFGMADFSIQNAINSAEENSLQLLRGECERLVQWYNYFMGFENVARNLYSANRPHLAGRLLEIGNTIRSILNTLNEMCDTFMRHRRTRGQIQQDVADYTRHTIQQVTQQQAAVFDAYRTRWSNMTFNKCPKCGSFLDSRLFPYCPYCNLLVVRY